MIVYSVGLISNKVDDFIFIVKSVAEVTREPRWQIYYLKLHTISNSYSLKKYVDKSLVYPCLTYLVENKVKLNNLLLV